ncbi:hypothetical protein C8R46DRAFT_1033817 [Mycena filopes]|nr:hypothetical protein C8R46DRAFT_1033817 [Mycena filopes]
MSIQGRSVYEAFQNVHVLSINHRSTDVVWASLLARARIARCNENDLALLRGRTLSHPTFNPADASWAGLTLLATRNTIIDRWNDAAIDSFRHRNDCDVYEISVFDTVNGEVPTMGQRLMIAHSKAPTHPHILRVAVGSPVLVLVGSQRIYAHIAAVIIDSREPAAPAVNLDTGDIVLRFLPVRIELQPASHLISPFSVEPSPYRFRLGIDNQRGLVRRLQYSLRPAFAVSIFDSQGLYFPRVIVDLADPARAVVTSAQAYTALSCAGRQSDVFLLRGFRESILTDSRAPDLVFHHDGVAATTQD